KTATEDQQIDTSEQRRDDVREFVARVADHGLGDDIDAETIELFGDVQRVGVNFRRREHLAADGHDRRPPQVRHDTQPAGASAIRILITPFPYNAAIPSSAMMPRPPCSLSKRPDGHGLTTSSALNTMKPTNAPIALTGRSANVINIPTTSSSTIGPGSVPPKWCSASVPLHTPIANKTTLTASSTYIEPLARTSAKIARPAADPNVPGATGA